MQTTQKEAYAHRTEQEGKKGKILFLQRIQKSPDLMNDIIVLKKESHVVPIKT